jgi:CheY-like chemotaxis protein
MTNEQKRILLLEDDFESMRDLKEYLEETQGWYVELSAERGLLERFRSERFDLVVLDLTIRPISLDAQGRQVQNIHFDSVSWQRTGLELLRRLRRGEFSEPGSRGTPPDVPALVLSAIASFSAEDPFKDDPAFKGYLEKPFRLDEMVERIRRLIQE